MIKNYLLILGVIGNSLFAMDYDFNGDGKADILWKKDKYYSLWYMSSDGKHKYKYIGKKSSPYEIVSVADFNGDGKADILWKKDKYYSIWYMNATGSHKYKYIGKKSASYEVVGTADFNGDGKADILWKKDKYYSIWYMNATGSHKYKYIGKKSASYAVVGTSDFNGDGKVDILWKKDNYYSLWYMNATGSHKYKYIGKKSASYAVVGTADFNGDGKADILWKKDKYYSLWYMKVSGKHKYKYIGKKSSSYNVSSVADLNGDGKVDILWKKDKYYSLWYMNASGSHKYKYIGKKSASYGVISEGNLLGTNSPIIPPEPPIIKVPLADAGSDQKVTVNGSVTLYGKGINGSGKIIGYEWKKGSQVLGTNAMLIYLPTTVGTDVLTLTVIDNNGFKASDSVTITILNEINKIPVVDAGEDKTVTVNSSVILSGSAIDSDGTIVSYEWKTSNGTLLGTEAILTYIPTVAGTETLTLTVSDDDGAIASDSVKLIVEEDDFGGGKK